MELNPAQLAAVQTLSGPLLVLAGAGSGKTRVVTYRIAELIRRGTRPERILAVTFTNKAAGEMQERVAERLGKRRKEKPEVSTFHSLCVRILRRHIERLGYPAAFSIYDRGDQESAARIALREIRVPDTVLRPGDLVNYVGRWKNMSLRPEQAEAAAETDKEHVAAIAYRRYQNALRLAGAVDFDDLLLLVEDLFEKFADVRRAEAGRFDHLLVDEYQDTNGSQYRIVKALATGHRNLCVVGDDDQSIYAWRGAEVTHILKFQKDWPEAKVVRLETNYRSTEEIMAWANTLIAFNRQRHQKVLRATARGDLPRIRQFEDGETEAKAVVDEIVGRIHSAGRKARDFAILFRTNEQPRAFEMELRRAKLPYVLVGGQSFYDRKEVRDVLAYLKLLANPRDEVSLRRVINTPPRGLGQATVTRCLEQAVQSQSSLWDVLSADAKAGRLPAAALHGFGRLAAALAAGRERLTGASLAEVVRQLVDQVGYRAEVDRLYERAEEQQARWQSVEDVVNAASAYGQRAQEATLAGFLHELMLSDQDQQDDKTSKLERDAVVLMTLHAAKGLEFREVYMVGMEEGLLPHRRSIEADGAAIDEERRLCYVGITRAQRCLTLTLALSRMKWGKPRPTIPSRFLYEVTGQANNPNYLSAIRQQLPVSARGRAAPGKPRQR